MSRSLIAASVLAAVAVSPALAYSPASPHAHAASAPTKTICGTKEKLCVSVPAGWTVKRTIKRLPHNGSQEVLSAGTKSRPQLFHLDTADAGIGGWCEPKRGYITQVVASTPTKATDHAGKRLYAIKWVESQPVDIAKGKTVTRWYYGTALTSEPALTKVRVTNNCAAMYAHVYNAKNWDAVVFINSPQMDKMYTSKANALAALNQQTEQIAYRVLTTARHAR